MLPVTSFWNLLFIIACSIFTWYFTLAFQSLYFESTWWRLFQKHVVHTKFDIYVCITVWGRESTGSCWWRQKACSWLTKYTQSWTHCTQGKIVIVTGKYFNAVFMMHYESVRIYILCHTLVWDIKYILYYTVKLRWLELEGTVKICSSYRKFEPPRSRNFREKKIRLWPRTVSLHYNWCTVKWTFLVKYIWYFRKFSKTTAFEYLFSRLWYLQTFLRNVFSLC